MSALMTIGRGPARPPDLAGALLECHDRIRRFLELAGGVAARDDLPAAEVTEACARVERYFREALPRHVEDEEYSIEPRLRGRSSEVDQALVAMHAEHALHDRLVGKLIDACAGLGAAPGDAARRRAVGEAAAALARELVPHLEQEEAIIIPALAALLDDDAREAIRAEMRARRKP